MLQLGTTTRVFICIKSVDFRKGIDGLSAVCRKHFLQDPMSGAVFVFRNRRCTSLRLLMYDGQGFWLCTKRLSIGTFKWWPNNENDINVRSLQTILWNGDPQGASFEQDWKKIST